jgi:uncharacterized protein (DUF2062 family)
MANNGEIPWAERLRRLVRYRLVVPLQRSPHPPEHTARGCLVGVAWAFTPLVGIQMPLVFLTWAVARFAFRWHFSLVVALAWTWVTNVFTMLPTYYVFFVTGQVLLLRPGGLTGYGAFAAAWDKAFNGDMTGWAAVAAYVRALANDFGLAMVVGCLPYAAAGGWLAYRWGLTVARRRRARLAANARGKSSPAP